MSTTPALPSYNNVPNMLALESLQLDEMFWQRACDLRVSVPSVVVSFDSNTQTVTVQPAIKETVYQNLVPTPVSLPQLPKVPILLMRGGGFTVTVPIQAGDECLVVFTDMCLDSWWQSGGTNNVQIERRRHDLTDGIAIFGIWSQPRVLQNYSQKTLQIRNDQGTILVELTANSININAGDGNNVNVTGNLNVSGNVNIQGDATIAGIDFEAHVHPGVTSGGADTGPPQA